VHVKDGLGEPLLLRRGDHQFGGGQPAVTVRTANLGLVDAAGKWPSQGLGQSRNRQEHRERISVHEHQARVRVYRPYRGKREYMVGAFEHPAAPDRGLMLKVLKKAFVKAVRLEMSAFVEPVTVARDAVCRVEAQAGENMRGDLGTFLRRVGVDR